MVDEEGIDVTAVMGDKKTKKRKADDHAAAAGGEESTPAKIKVRRSPAQHCRLSGWGLLLLVVISRLSCPAGMEECGQESAAKIMEMLGVQEK